MKRILLSILYLISICTTSLLCANDTIIGNRFIKNFSTESFELQNWSIVQDQRGVMYFGNGAGVLEFDGNKWKAIKTANNSTVRSLDIDDNGKIFVGATGEFGYLDVDSIGNLYYVSLSPLIKDSVGEIKRILKTFCTSEGVYFISLDKIFRYYNNKISIIPTDLSSQQRYGFNINDQIFLIQKGKGMSYINGNELIDLPHTEAFSTNYGRYVILPSSENKLLIVTQFKGFFSYNLDMISHHGKIFQGNTNENTAPSILKKINSPVTDYIKTHSVYSATKVDSNTIALGTMSGGIVLIDQKTNLLQIINKEKGLKGNSILDLYVDDSKNLWAGLQDGISLVELNSPLTFFNEANGLEGISLTTAEFNGKRYVGTHIGLYNLLPYKLQLENDNYSFQLLENGKSTCLNLFQFKNHLLASTSKGVMKIKKNSANIFLEKVLSYSIKQSNKFENVLFFGSTNGLSYVKLVPEYLKIVELKQFEGITNSIIEMVNDANGNMWLTTQFNGIIHLEFPSDNIDDYVVHKYDTTHGLPSLIMNYVHHIDNKLILATREGVYSLDESKTETLFIKDTTYCAEQINEECRVSKIIPYNSETSYIYSENLGVGILSLKDKYFDTKPFSKIPPESIYNIFLDEEFLWICTIDGLFKYSHSDLKDYNKPFNTLIRKVISGKDSLLFGGTLTNDTLALIHPKIEYKHNAITFEFSSPFYENNDEIDFQYKLDGFDEEWNDWSSKTEKSYTNLWEGKYTFLVKAKNLYGTIGETASFTFIVTPPWYRTILAYISYLILLGISIYVGFRLYARRLVEQNIKLEKIIKKRTAEIREQRDQIAEQKQNITDSILYARKIQNALLPPVEIINKHLAEYFILFKPRDIVSGDFYWFTEKNEKVYITAADCTGHGVPGAFMSMLGISFLNEIVSNNASLPANELLDNLRDYVKTSLRQTGKAGESKDGMDMALCIIDKKNMKLEYAGANNPLYLIRNGELEQYKADRMPIGVYIKDDRAFTNYVIDIQKDDLLYIFSDGYVDQFGGEKGKKFMPKNFKSLLLENHQKPMEYQRDILDQTIEVWKGETEQVDDILVIGIKIT